jgi:hypothetical protein
MNTKLQDLGGSDCWEVVGDPRVMFVCDGGRTISFLQHHLGKAEQSGDMLTIEVVKGKVKIGGPKVKELHRDFCRGKCTMIKADGVDITSVNFIAL